MKKQIKAKTITFGFSKKSRTRVDNFSPIIRNGLPVGISFDIKHKNKSITIEIPGAIGKPHAYAAAAGAAVGLALNYEESDIKKGLNSYKPEKGRAEIVKGKNATVIINDSYNSGPLAAKTALETLKDIPAKRKVAVLGDMKELGEYTKNAHLKLGRGAAAVADIIVAVGDEAKYIKKAAISAGAEKDKIFYFKNAEAALKQIDDIIQTGDLILIKASRSVGLDKITDALKR